MWFRCTRARRFCAFDRPIKYLPAGLFRGVNAAASLKRDVPPSLGRITKLLPRRECRGLIEAMTRSGAVPGASILPRRECRGLIEALDRRATLVLP